MSGARRGNTGGGRSRTPPRGVVTVEGLRVDRGLLASRGMRRCDPRECGAYCCGGGVAISVHQTNDILAHAALVAAALPRARRDPTGWFRGRHERERDHPAGGTRIATEVVDDPGHPTGTSCVFLRPDRKCALQVASVAAREHPWRFKPLFCALHPLTFERGVLVLADRNPMYIDGGRCSRWARDGTPVSALLSRELRWVLGAKGYAVLRRMARARASRRRSSA